ncbi:MULTISPECIES: LysR family transcriptional regulator [Pontibacillus]|uniref:LysR family transcriptional regulator n=1 Tax=Pontibacillus chungwhensis TaxID=265426 RepID=A0ABY8UWA8_9BACI|nr:MULTISPECIES: LysR family transcriptional regulator [Pontibacillus]MCD5323968.1 LysR family transcriptional regulator [Pontibacillus sp. HN14]WIF97967.1 LysR family transcriptional regulator [Pontibacillus chungwhensis]
MNDMYKVFITVVEQQGFSKAAEHLYMTQPAVSQYIKSLESKMGVKLLDRTYKKMVLTKAGEIVYEHAKQMIGHQETMHHLIHELYNEPKGELSIGASYTYGEYVLPRIIAQMRKEYPSIHPKITIGNTQDIAKQVADMALDIGIVEGEVEEPSIDVHPFADDEMKIVASHDHPLVQKEEVTVHDLEQAMWITREKGSGTREATERMFENVEIDPTERMEFGSTQIIKESVEAGLGLTFLSLWTIRKEMAMETLEVIDLPKATLKRSFSILLRQKPMHTKATTVFYNLIQSHK